MKISFDSSVRLKRNVYYFKYGSHEFKLIQHRSPNHKNALLTIVQDCNEKYINSAYSAASEFLAALSWEHSSKVVMSLGHGGSGINENFKLRSAKCHALGHSVYRKRRAVGFDIDVIPSVETRDQRTALILYRDAESSNHIYLSFLLFWQIMEIQGEKASVLVNDVYKKYEKNPSVFDQDMHLLRFNGKPFNEWLNKNYKSIGENLLDDCRHAIAHITRTRSGKTAIRLDNATDNRRISWSLKIVHTCAKIYIEEHLKLDNRMYLVKRKDEQVPFYVESGQLGPGTYSDTKDIWHKLRFEGKPPNERTEYHLVKRM